MAALGFNWGQSQPELVNTLFDNANGAQANLNAQGYFKTTQQTELNAQGYFTADQVQALHVNTPLIQRNAGSGEFTLTLGLEKSTTLQPGSFQPFPFNAPATSVNGEGKIQFQFTSPDNAAFFRLQAE